MSRTTAYVATAIGLATLVLMGGCPVGQSTTEYIAGSVGDTAQVANVASVRVLSPVSDLQIAGGTPVEVNWQAVATTRNARIRVFLDSDNDATNGNETTVAGDLTLSDSTLLIDTARLAAGTYYIGVQVIESSKAVATGYAPGRIIVNQRPDLFFSSPRNNFTFDRTTNVNPRFDVAWTLSDPDSIVTVRIFLDPDDVPNGNEILLRTSNSQTGDSFSFDLPTASFAPGTYRLLALVSDGVDGFPTYAPGSILLRTRLAGFVDLRDLGLPSSSLQGAVFEGFNPRDNAGSFVTSAKDIDGDGFGDFLITAQFGKPQYQFNSQRTGVGEAYLVYGRANRFSGYINLNSTGTLFRGEIYGGVPEVPDPIRPSRGITSFAVLSDWDGDGIREFAFGLPFTDSQRVGTLGAGTDASRAAPLDSSGWFRTGGVIVAAGSSLRPDLGFPGRNVFNLAEFGTLVHGPFTPRPPCQEGFYGPKSPANPGGVTSFNRHEGDPETPNIGSVRLGARFSSLDFGDQFGETISSYDFDSILFSVPNRDPITNTLFNFTANNSIPGAGVVSIFYCYAGVGFYPWTNINAPAAGNGYAGTPGNPDTEDIPHYGPYFYAVDDVRPAGNGQVGAPGFTVDGNPSPDGQPCSMNFSVNCPTITRTTRIWGGFTGARIGGAVSVRDFNADGLQDILIGSPLSNDGAGAAFLVLGRLRELVVGGEFGIEELGLPLNAAEPARRRIFDGIRVVGNPGDRLGQSQDSAGDFNNDGISDVLIGSPLVNGRRGGAAVFFGSRTVINLTESDIPFDQIPARGLGVIFVGEEEGDLAGARVTGVGDIDGDGNDDILIAAPNRSVQLDTDLDGRFDIDRKNCGVVYLVYGSPKLTGTISLSEVGSERLPGAVFIGRNSSDFLGAGLGDQGDRSVGIAGAGDIDGDGKNDLLLGSVVATPRNRVHAGEAYLLYGIGD